MMNVGTEIALQGSISDIIAEYDHKVLNIKNAIASFEQAQDDLKSASCVSGTWGETTIDTGSIHESTLLSSLVKSGWRHIYKGLNIETIATASDKKLFEQAMANPPELTMENVRATFGDYVADPRGNILRGLAEVFCSLDPAFKSHDKVAIGVKGLPKRVIITNVNSIHGWGKDRLRDMLNALAAYQGKALVTYQELNALMDDGDIMLNSFTLKGHKNRDIEYPSRGIRLVRYKNGNGHLYFEPDTLKDINRALAEYYGEVLADCSEAKPEKKRTSTAVAKDLQYYPTPQAVIDSVIHGLYRLEGQKVLEPSCGCGRFLDALRDSGAEVFGIEVDHDRAMQCREKGHNVLTTNFLETLPTDDYDRVVMNPPFYGKHYAKHVEHALKFLKPGGVLTAILPATARYDHGLLDGSWQDLPFGSFRESGTNINTTVLTIKKPK